MANKRKNNLIFPGIMVLIVAATFYAFLNQGGQNMKYSPAPNDLEIKNGTGIRNGDIPSDFVVLTSDGTTLWLHDVIGKGKPAVIYFMATWCEWCRKDYAELSKVYGKYENNITIISISLDLSENFLKLREYKKGYPELEKTIFAQGQKQILKDYGITKTTTKYFIYANGTIKYRTIGAIESDEWDSMLKELLK